MKASPDGRPCAHHLVSSLLYARVPYSQPQTPPKLSIPPLWQQLYLLVEYHVHTMGPNVSRCLPQKAQDVFDGGCVGQASEAYTISPSSRGQWEGNGQQRSSQCGKEWAGCIAVQDLVRKAATGWSCQVEDGRGILKKGMGVRGALGAHLLHLGCSAPKEFNVSLTQHALMPA